MTRTLAKRLLLAAVLAAGAVPASAEPLLGLWRTMPDGKNQTGHVRIAPCGAALCGTVISAYDEEGREITTSNVGRRILWNLERRGAAVRGRVYVPIMGRDFGVKIRVQGDRLELRACNALGLCRSRTWTRVR